MMSKALGTKGLCVFVIGILVLSTLMFATFVSGTYTGEITVYPGSVDIVTTNLTGSKQITFWSNQSMDSVNVTVLNSNHTEFLDQLVWQDEDDWSLFWSFEAQLASGNTTYSIDLVNCSILSVHIWGHSDVEDLDLGIFLDGKNGEPVDGLTQANESVTYCADADADEEVLIQNPENGTYLIKVFGFTVPNEPGHFDMTIDVISEMPGIFNVTDVSSTPLSSYTLRSFNLTWELPGGSADGKYIGGLYIGTNSEYNITLVPITLSLDRAAPDIIPSYPGTNEEIEEVKPLIQVLFSDAERGELDSSSARLWVDGVEVTCQCEVNIPYAENADDILGYWYGIMIYTPDEPMSNGVHSITAVIYDLAGNDITVNWFFTVKSPYQPYIEHTPEVMTSINYVTPISAIVESDFRVASVDLFYKNEGDASYIKTPMERIGINIYYNEIPAQQSIDKINYYLRVEDVDGNAATQPVANPDTSPFELQVNDHGCPRITHLPPILYGDEPLTIDAVISDDVGIDDAILFYKSESAGSFSTAPMTNIGNGHIYTATITTTDINPENILYYIQATDGSNNVTHPTDMGVPHEVLHTATFVPGGDLRVAIHDDVKTLNPLAAGDPWSTMVLDRIYDVPMMEDPVTDETIPYIAVGSANTSTSIGPGEVGWDDCDIGNFGFTPESTWGQEVPTSDVGECMIFYDFTNVKWQDGTQMSVRDILFSLHVNAQVPEWSSSMNCLKENGGKTPSNFSITSWLHIYKVWESGDGMQTAIKFVMTEPFADFFKHTLSPVLLPYHVWGYTISGQNVDAAKIWCDPGYDIDNPDTSWQVDLAQAWDNPDPVGSNEFNFIQRNPGLSIELQTWRDHFYKEGFQYDDRGLAKQPTIDNLTFKVYMISQSAVLALKYNDIDFIGWSVPPTFVQELLNEPGVSIQQSPEPGFHYLAYNMRRQSFGYDETKSFPYAPEEDLGKPFRRAVAHCIDKNKIVQRLLLNYGIAGEGPVSSISPWFNVTIPRYAFDPGEAIDILTAAGYNLDDPGQPPGPGNHWNNPDGSEIGSGPGGLIEILTPEANYDPIRAQAGLMIAQQLQDIGINAQSVAMDFGSIVDRIEQRDFDMYILGWTINTRPPVYLYDFYHSTNAASGQNYPGYQNITYDDLIDMARATGDENERVQAIFDAQAAIAYDLPTDALYYRTNIEAYRSDRFTGWIVGSSGSIFNEQSLRNIRHPFLSIPSESLERREYGGNLKVALQSEPNTLNPLSPSINEPAAQVIDLLYDSLGRIDPYSLELMPWVAEDWAVSSDNLTITVTLRDNVTWHNGSVLNAPDVKYTFDTYALTYISSVTVIDNNTLTFSLVSPNAKFFTETMLLPLIPQGYDAASNENGCGPFKLKEMLSGGHLALEHHEGYFYGRANIDSITFTYYPLLEDAAHDLITGDLDFIAWDLLTNETYAAIIVDGNLTMLILEPDINVVRNAGYFVQHIGYNTQRSPLNDSVLRKAMTHSIDKEMLALYDISGGIYIADSIMTKYNYPYWNDTVPRYRGETEIANQILDEAGYFDRDGDGWRDLPYAPYDPFNLTLLGPPLEDVHYTMSVNLISMIQDIGINITLVSNTSQVNWQAINNDDFDLYFDAIMGEQDPAFLNELAYTGASPNYANYADATMDALLDRMNSEMNATIRAQYAQDCEGHLAEQLPYAPLFHYRVNNAYNNERFEDWVSTLGGIDNFWSYLGVIPLFDPTPVDAPVAPLAYDPGLGRTINLTWAPNNEKGLTGYNIYRSNISGGPYELIESIGLVTAYQDNTTEDLVDYYYVITGIGSESKFSREVWCRSSDLESPIVLLTFPKDGAVGVNISTNITIVFNEGMDMTSVENAFSYSNGTDTWTVSDGTVGWNSSDNFTFTPPVSLSYNTTFIITINGSIARDIAGNLLDGNGDGVGGDGYSWQFTTEVLELDITPPAAPTNLTVTDPGTGGALNLTWDGNPEPDLAGYNVYRSMVSGSNYSLVATLGLVTAHQDINLTDESTYYYVITAYDNASIPNESEYSNEANGTPTEIPTEIPTGNITGTVLDEDGNPVANATVTVEGTNLSATTDENGEYTITDVPIGPQTLIITREGYEDKIVEITVNQDETTEIPDIVLQPEDSGGSNIMWIIIIVIIIIVSILIVTKYFLRDKDVTETEPTQEEMEIEPETEDSHEDDQESPISEE